MLSNFLPNSIYCHLNIDTYKHLLKGRILGEHIKYYNMKLNKESFINIKDIDYNIEVNKLNPSKKEELIEFFNKNHPVCL